MTAFLSLILCFASQDVGKTSTQDEKTRELEQEAPPAPESQDLLWDWGGWMNAQFLSLEDEPFDTRREQRFWDNRLWGTVTIEKRYRVYARVRNTYQDFNEGDQFGATENEWKTLRLDQGYVEASWPEWATSVAGQTANLHARVGRQYLVMGTGLLLNGIYDGIEVDGSVGPWSLRLFSGLTIGTTDDIDRSLPDRDDSHRIFTGLDFSYAGFGAHRPYGMVLVERDRNDEDDPNQDYTYNAEYYALGMRGTLFMRGLGYHVEAAYEGGRSPAAGADDQEIIKAFAFVVNLEYYAPLPTSPLFFGGLWWATGDKDRASPTDSTSGNTDDTDDKGFLPFGYLNTGFAVSPRLTNIHILRIGATFKPLEKLAAWTKTLELGVTWYLFSKDQASEPITDPRSFLNKKEIGSEIDLFLRWRILSDLGLSVNYGHFMPGRAYLEDSDRDFFSAGLTYSF